MRSILLLLVFSTFSFAADAYSPQRVEEQPLTTAVYAVKDLSAATATLMNVSGSNQTARRKILLQNVGSSDIYIGFNNSVTNTAYGAVLKPLGVFVENIGSTGNVYVYSITACTKCITVQEFAR